MLTKRIIPCLDVKAGQVVKGVQFKNVNVVGNILDLAPFYGEQGADELVFYDISASVCGSLLEMNWITEIAKRLDIPFCVAGGIKSRVEARQVLNLGADKVSINSAALVNPTLITELSEEFGAQAVVVSIDSIFCHNDYYVCQFTGDEKKSSVTHLRTLDWVQQIEKLGAGEIVLNCMDQDGVRHGYDIQQLLAVKRITTLPLIASGGAGEMRHFRQVFQEADVEGALAASVFHDQSILIPELKKFLLQANIEVRR